MYKNALKLMFLEKTRARGTSVGAFLTNEIRNGTIRIEKQFEAEFRSIAKISMDQAVQQALASVQGQGLKTELEDENGFSGLWG